MKKLRIGYFADGPWSHRALEKIMQSENFEIQFICLRFGKNDEFLKAKAAQLKIPLLTFPNVNTADCITKIKALGCDLLVSMSFDQIFKKEILQLAPLGIINCHAGLLPFYRGRNVLNWVLINDEKEFGVTVHHVDAGIDTGDIILQTRLPITDEDTYASLLEKAYSECAEVLFKSILQLSNGEAKRIPQNSIHPVGLYCGQRKMGDEIINWQQTSRELFNFVRALSHPGPLATTSLDGERVQISKVRLVAKAPDYTGIPGQVLHKTEYGFLVKTSDSFIEVTEFTSGRKIKVGDRFL